MTNSRLKRGRKIISRVCFFKIKVKKYAEVRSIKLSNSTDRSCWYLIWPSSRNFNVLTLCDPTNLRISTCHCFFFFFRVNVSCMLCILYPGQAVNSTVWRDPKTWHLRRLLSFLFVEWRRWRAVLWYPLHRHRAEAFMPILLKWLLRLLCPVLTVWQMLEFICVLSASVGFVVVLVCPFVCS